MLFVEFLLRFLKHTFIIIAHPKVNFLTKDHELIDMHREKKCLVEPGMSPDKIETKQVELERGVPETSHITRIHMAARACVG